MFYAPAIVNPVLYTYYNKCSVSSMHDIFS